MKGVSIYGCLDKITFAPQGRAPSGWIMDRTDMITRNINDPVDHLKDLLKKVVESFDSTDDESLFDPRNFNRIVAKKTTGQSYSKFLEGAASISVAVSEDKVIIQPMKKSNSFKGFEGYQDITEELPLSSLEDGTAMNCILDLLAKVIKSYDFSA